MVFILILFMGLLKLIIKEEVMDVMSDMSGFIEW